MTKTAKYEFPGYMVAVQQIVMAVGNHFKLPIEQGYEVAVIGNPRELSVEVKVTAPLWGPGSALKVKLWRDGFSQLWATPQLADLSFENSHYLPESVRGKRFKLDLERADGWPEIRNRSFGQNLLHFSGTYPRYMVRHEFREAPETA